jgi:hypothetical protein
MQGDCGSHELSIRASRLTPVSELKQFITALLQPVLSTTAQIPDQSESILIGEFQPLVRLIAPPPGHG